MYKYSIEMSWNTRTSKDVYQNKHINSQTQTIVWCLPEGKQGGKRMKRVKEAKYMEMNGGQTLGSKYTIHYIDDVL